MSHPSEEQLVFHYYGEDSSDIDTHLESCAECRLAYHSLQRVLNAVDGAPVPDRRLDYGAHLWRTLEPKLGGSRWFDWNAWLPPQKLALAACIALLVIASFLAGRWMAPTRVTEMVALDPEAVKERVLLVALGDHLDRSQMVLVELVNAQAGREVDISNEQRWAEDLVGANRLYRQTAATTGDESLSAVLDDLERVLVEIARGPSTLSPDELDEIRRRIESQGILFKVRVLGSRVRDPETLANLQKF